MPAKNCGMRLARLLIRRSIAGLCLCVAMIVAAIMVLPDDLVDHSIANNRIVEREFSQAALAIDAFHHHNARWPSEKQLAGLAGWPQSQKYPLFVFFDDAGMCADHDGFPQTAKGTYVLGAWRGDWMDCFEPRARLTTLEFSRDDYALFGSTMVDRSAAVALIALLMIAARLLWTGGRVAGLDRRSEPSSPIA